MSVTVEVPDGHKFCKKCGSVFPKEGNFQVKRSTNPQTGTVSAYYESRCKRCANADRNANRRKRQFVRVAPKRPPLRYLPPRPPEEVPCDMAFMQWQGGEPRQDWRVRL